jgi:hypothetical protein
MLYMPNLLDEGPDSNFRSHAAADLQKVSYIVYMFMIYLPSFVKFGQKHKQ